MTNHPRPRGPGEPAGTAVNLRDAQPVEPLTAAKASARLFEVMRNAGLYGRERQAVEDAARLLAVAVRDEALDAARAADGLLRKRVRKLEDHIRFDAIPSIKVLGAGNNGAAKTIRRLESAVGPSSGHGRVTDPRFDQRLKANRDRKAALRATATEEQGHE